MLPLVAFLITVTLLGGYASVRLHAAAGSALREVRADERRLDPAYAGGPGRRLDDELRSLAEIADAARESRWRESAVLMALLSAAAVTVAIWTLTDEQTDLDAFSIVALALATVLITALFVLDGARTASTLAAAVRRSPLWDVHRVEDAIAAVDRAAAEVRARSLAPEQPIALLRPRSAGRAPARVTAARHRLRRTQVDLPAVAATNVRFPAGYLDGLRGLLPLTGGRLAADQAWSAALTDLGRAAELDEPRRTRWLSALAACAELRDDPPARESAARWALEAAAAARIDSPAAMRRRPGPPRDPRTDPLPATVALGPTRADTWAGALRRARTVGAPPWLLADLVVRWAAAEPSALEPPVAAAVDVMHELPDADEFLAMVRLGLERLGADADQMGRLVQPRTRVPVDVPVAERPVPAADRPVPAADRPLPAADRPEA